MKNILEAASKFAGFVRPSRIAFYFIASNRPVRARVLLDESIPKTEA